MHRLHDAKREVVIYDHVDKNVPVLARMAAKRRSGYLAIGYRFPLAENLVAEEFATSNSGAGKSGGRLIT